MPDFLVGRSAKITIEIRQPELEALIRQWMDTGAFTDVEDILLQALTTSATPQLKSKPKQNFAEFLLAFPLPGAGLVLERNKD